MLDRSMPVAAMMPVWLKPSASATAWRTANWRGVTVSPTRSANSLSALWPARCRRCTTDCSGDESAFGRACAMERSLAAGKRYGGLVEGTDQMEEDDHHDRYACQPKNDVAKHCCLFQVGRTGRRAPKSNL